MTAEEFKNTLIIIAQEYKGSIPKKEIFSLAKTFQETPIAQVIKLLKNENNDYRLGAVSILDWKAQIRKLL